MNEFNAAVIEEFRATGGTVTDAAPFGRSLVLLHHVGARSGAVRVNPLMHVRHDADTWLVAASKAGAPEHPAWYHNLLAHPDTTIETPDEGVVEVRAEELTGAARDAAWQRFVAAAERFAGYQEQTTRTIPVVALRRRS